MNKLTFRYSGLTLFRHLKDACFEIHLIVFDAPNLDESIEIAEEKMRRYASENGLQFCEVLNVYEFGSDMLEEYGEVYSLICPTDSVFEKMFIDKLTCHYGNSREK